jgi:hypothetical protein
MLLRKNSAKQLEPNRREPCNDLVGRLRHLGRMFRTLAIRHAIAPFFDPTLAHRCNAAQSEWRDACQEAVDKQTDQERLDGIAAQAEALLEPVREQIKALEEQVRIDTTDYELPARPDMPEPNIPVQPDGLPLVNSAWSWTEQSRRLIASKAYDGASE